MAGGFYYRYPRGCTIGFILKVLTNRAHLAYSAISHQMTRKIGHADKSQKNDHPNGWRGNPSSWCRHLCRHSHAQRGISSLESSRRYTEPRKRALSYAILAPNPHNRQPWLVDLSQQDLIVLHIDSDKMLPHTDPFNR